MMASRAPLAIPLVAASCVIGLMAQSPSPVDLQQRAHAAVRKTLPLLQSSGRVWNERRPCASCHHHALGSMAVELARNYGFSVDEHLLAEQVSRMRFRTREGASRTC